MFHVYHYGQIYGHIYITELTDLNWLNWTDWTELSELNWWNETQTDIKKICRKSLHFTELIKISRKFAASWNWTGRNDI